MGNQTVGVGVVGTGFGTLVAAPAFANIAGVSLAAVCARHMERARAAASEFEGAFATDDVCALCARPDVDIVFVATPPHLHRDTVLTALDAGKHVVCEKPFGTSPTDARVMLDRAQASSQLHFLDFEFRTTPARRAVADIIGSGALGDIRHATITAMVAGGRFPVMNRDGWWQRRDLGGGWLGAMGSHYLDAIRVWFGEIELIGALLETRRTSLSGSPEGTEITADDGFVARLVTKSGVMCVLDTASSIGVEIGPRIEIYGTTGTAVLEHEHVLTVTDATGAVERVDFTPTKMGTDHPSRGPLDAWAAQVIDAVRTGEQLAPNFLDGLRAQEAMAAARKSHDRGGIQVRVDHYEVTR